jgi:hypothetical protein
MKKKEKEKLLIEFINSLPVDLYVWRDTMFRHVNPFLNKEINKNPKP